MEVLWRLCRTARIIESVRAGVAYESPGFEWCLDRLRRAGLA